MAKRANGLEPLASTVQRLGVMLAAGVAPASALGYVAEGSSGTITPQLTEIAARAARGDSIGPAIVAVSETTVRSEAPAWRALAAAWIVATDAGAPLAATLAEFAATLRALAQNERDLRTALAAPAATARLVSVLPVIGVLFGLALGFDTLGTLFTTVPGIVCLVVGVLLMLAARHWNRRLIASARPTDLSPGLGLDLMAIAVSGGASVPRALAAVAAVRLRCGLETDDDHSAAIDEVLALSKRAGVPAAALLRSEASEARRLARSEGQRKAETLTITLMLPLGLCILPAFMLLGVAPLLISVITATVSGL
jgi:tight adherence protein B